MWQAAYTIGRITVYLSTRCSPENPVTGSFIAFCMDQHNCNIDHCFISSLLLICIISLKVNRMSKFRLALVEKAGRMRNRSWLEQKCSPKFSVNSSAIAMSNVKCLYIRVKLLSLLASFKSITVTISYMNTSILGTFQVLVKCRM